ncbi:MAG: hypothetical protein RIG82_02910 [Phycisphaeraceae bacterium]
MTTQTQTPIHHAVTGKRYERTLWIGTADHDALAQRLHPGLELVRLGERGFWSLEATPDGLLPHLLTQAMTSDGDLIRGLAPAQINATSAIDIAAAQDRLDRPHASVFATATDLREWLTAPMWSRTLDTRDGFLIAAQPLPWPDTTQGVWSTAPQPLDPVLDHIWQTQTRLEARLTLVGVVRTRELIRKPLLKNSLTPTPVALSA